MKRIVRREQIPALFFVLLLYIPAINYFIADILVNDLGRPSLSVPFYVLLSVVGFLSFFYIDKINKKVVVIALLLGFLTIVSTVLYPEILPYLLADNKNPQESDAIMLFLYSVPAMILGNYTVRKSKWDDVIYFFKPLSLFLTIIGICSYILTVLINGHYLDYEYMSFSYFMLPGVVYTILIGATERRFVYLIAGLVGFVIILVGGSRGALVCAVLAFIISVFQCRKVKKMIYLIAGAVVALFIVINSFDSFSEIAQDYMTKHDAYSRNLAKIEDGSMTYSEGREVITNYLKVAIADNPLGYGLFGDRHVLIPKSYLYSHSIIYEFMVDFGVFLGPLFLLVLFVLTFRRLFKYPPKESNVILVLVCCGLLKLIFSGTYLTEIFFWALVGVIIERVPHINSYEKKSL